MDPTPADVHVDAPLGKKKRRKKPMDSITNYASLVGKSAEDPMGAESFDVVVLSPEADDAWREHMEKVLVGLAPEDKPVRIAWTDELPDAPYAPLFDLVAEGEGVRLVKAAARSPETKERAGLVRRLLGLGSTTSTFPGGTMTLNVRAHAQEEPIQKAMYRVQKSDEPRRFTLGPVYIPNTVDAHDEWTDAENLQNAAWEFVKAAPQNQRMIDFQHTGVPAGEWLEIVNWPLPVTTELMLPDGEGGFSKREVTLPAGTEYMGVQWSEKAWPLVDEGKLRALSMSGWSRKITAEFEGA